MGVFNKTSICRIINVKETMDNTTVSITDNTTDNINTTFNVGLLTETLDILLAYDAYLCISMVLSFMGNLLVLVVYSKTGTNNSTDWFLIFITIYDFVSSFLNVPVYLTLTTGLWQQFGNDVICKIHRVFSQSTVLSSAILIGGLALERYFKVCRPRTRISKICSRNICIAISTVTFVLSLPVVPFFDNSSGLCKKVEDAFLLQLHFIYYAAFVLVFLVLFFVVIFSYSSIAYTILRSTANLERHSSATANIVSEVKCIQCFRLLCCGNRHSRATVISEKRVTDAEVNQSSRRITTLPLAAYKLSDSSISDVIKSALPIPCGSRRPRTICKPGEKNANIRKSLRTTRLTFAVCLVYVVSWLPPWAWFPVSYYVTPQTVPYSTHLALRLFCSMTFLINTFTNPFLFIAMNGAFREKVKNLLLCK